MQTDADICVRMDPISAVYSEGRVVVPAQNEANSLYQDGYGSLIFDSRLLTLRPFEALYLVEMGKVSILDEESRERLALQELLWRFSDGDPNIWTRYVVYRDLRARGFVAREGPGHGVDFLVYERGSFGRKTPRYLVYAIWEGAQESVGHLNEILVETEEAGMILRLAVIDRRGEIVYYTLSEMKFQITGGEAS
jgi:tRNA-intron endonuclease